jgi:hypothetical protein
LQVLSTLILARHNGRKNFRILDYAGNAAVQWTAGCAKVVDNS